MDTTRWNRIQCLYLEALDAPPDARDALLDGDDVDEDIRREVREMLAVSGSGSELRVESKLLGDREGTPESERLVHERVGRYRILDRIGRGGMGDVFHAVRDEDGVRQEVAVKLLRTSALSSEMAARFRSEQTILARLTHPSIVRLLDSGVTGDGQPYFVMPIVRGDPITEWCDARCATIDRRLQLFRAVCDAVQHAHRNLVVHRDLKPSNVLVTEDGGVQLLDFGIAKLTDPEIESEALTRTGLALMTPEYASPEQVRGEPATTAVDVYALGVMLFELLTGARPHVATRGGRVELERAIRETSPPTLASVVDEQGASVRGTTVRELTRRLGGDLETIVRTALHKDPERRYASPADLAEDLERWRSARPIRARADTWAYRARTFVRRNRAASAAAVVVVLALLGSVATFWTQSRRATTERDRLVGVVRALTEVFEAADPVRTPGVDTLHVSEFLVNNEDRILGALADDPILESAMATTFGSLHYTRERWGTADSLFSLAYERNVQTYGESHPQTLAALHSLATVRATMEAPGADSLMRRVVDGLRETSEEPTEELASAVSDLAMLTESWPERRELLTEMIRIRSVICGEDEICHALGYNALATACFQRDSLEAAIAHYEAALDHLHRALPADHPHALTVARNLASALSTTGHAARAESLFTWILEREREQLGEGTSRFGLNLNNLALAQLVGGRYEAARVSLERAIEVQRGAFGEHHPRVANSAYNLFRLHLIRDDLPAAREALDATLAACADDDELRARYAVSRAALELAEGQTSRAKDRLLAWRETNDWEEETRMTANVRFLLARALLASGDVAGAESELRRLRRYYETRGAYRELMLAAIDGGLGICLLEHGDLAGGRRMVERALEVYGSFGAAEPAFVRRLEAARGRALASTR